MKPYAHEHVTELDRNRVAAALSVIPGLGQIYKRHYVFGVGLMLIGIPCVLWASVLLTLATLGLSLVVGPLAFWVLVAFDAYEIEDWHPDALPPG